MGQFLLSLLSVLQHPVCWIRDWVVGCGLSTKWCHGMCHLEALLLGQWARTAMFPFAHPPPHPCQKWLSWLCPMLIESGRAWCLFPAGTCWCRPWAELDLVDWQNAVVTALCSVFFAVRKGKSLLQVKYWSTPLNFFFLAWPCVVNCGSQWDGRA